MIAGLYRENLVNPETPSEATELLDICFYSANRGSDKSVRHAEGGGATAGA